MGNVPDGMSREEFVSALAEAAEIERRKVDAIKAEKAKDYEWTYLLLVVALVISVLFSVRQMTEKPKDGDQQSAKSQGKK